MNWLDKLLRRRPVPVATTTLGGFPVPWNVERPSIHGFLAGFALKCLAGRSGGGASGGGTAGAGRGCEGGDGEVESGLSAAGGDVHRNFEPQTTQILATHNVFVLICGLGLSGRLAVGLLFGE